MDDLKEAKNILIKYPNVFEAQELSKTIKKLE